MIFPINGDTRGAAEFESCLGAHFLVGCDLHISNCLNEIQHSFFFCFFLPSELREGISFTKLDILRAESSLSMTEEFN